jgi:hypothetical protein
MSECYFDIVSTLLLPAQARTNRSCKLTCSMDGCMFGGSLLPCSGCASLLRGACAARWCTYDSRPGCSPALNLHHGDSSAVLGTTTAAGEAVLGRHYGLRVCSPG